MAAAVAVVAGYAAGQAVVAGIAGSIVLSALQAAVISGVVGVVVSGVVTSAFAETRQPNQDSPVLARREEGFLVNTSATDSPIPVWYGFRAVAGIRDFKEVGGPNNEYLYLRYILSEGPIAGVETVYINDLPSTDPKYSGLVTIEHHNGTAGDTLSAMLNSELPGKFASTDTGNLIAYTIIRLKFNRDVFPGEPTVRFEGRGRLVKSVIDGVTRFGNNPADCLRDYLTNTLYGRAIPEAAIPDSDWATEAAYYDARESVPTYSAVCSAQPGDDTLKFDSDQPFDNGDGVNLTTTGGAPGGITASTTYYVIRVGLRTFKLATSYANALARTAINITSAGTGVHTLHHLDQARYTCDGVIDPENDVIDNIIRMRSSAQAWLFDQAGTYRLVTDRTASTGFAFTRDNMIGSWRITKGGKDGRFNRVRANFWDPMLGWQRNFAIVDSSTDRTADGGRVLQGVIELDFTTNLFRARRIASLEQRKSRLVLKASMKAAIQSFKAQCADVVSITHAMPGWSAQTFRVLRIGLGQTDEFEFDVREYADIWTGLSPGDAFTPPARTNLPNPADYRPARVSGLELFGQGNDTAFVGRDAKAVWRKSGGVNYGGVGGQPAGQDSADPWFKDFQVTVKGTDGTERRTEYVTDPIYIYSYEKNAEDGLRLNPTSGAAVRGFEFFVWSRSIWGTRSALPARLAVSNAAPTIAAITVTPIDYAAVVSYPKPADLDWNGMRFYLSTSSGFTPGAANIVYDGIDAAFPLSGLAPGTTYYYRYALSDAFGYGSNSAQASFTTAADSAGAAAASALAQLADIAADDVLTAVEKPILVRDYAVITAEQSGIDAQATSYSITTEKTAYDSAVTALTTYLGTLTSPVAWNVLTGSTSITGTTLRSKFSDVYTTRQALLTKIDAVAGTKATWASVSGTGKPADYADVTSANTAAAIAGQGALATKNVAGASDISVSNLAAINADLGAITAGTVTLNSSGHIKSGQTAFNTGTGFWLGIDSGTGKFSIGDAGANSMSWDGSALTVRGDVKLKDYTAGSNLFISSDSVKTTVSNAPAKLKEIVVTRYGTVTVYFEARENSGAGPSAVAHARIYRNGSAVGATRAPSESDGWVGYSENITVSPGDALQIYAWEGSGSGAWEAEVQNFRLKCGFNINETVTLA